MSMMERLRKPGLPAKEVIEMKLNTGVLQDTMRHVAAHAGDATREEKLAYTRSLLQAISQETAIRAGQIQPIPLQPTGGPQLDEFASTARKLIKDKERRRAEVEPQVSALTAAEQLPLVREAAQVQNRLKRRTGVDVSEDVDYRLPADKVKEAKWKNRGSIGLNIFYNGVSYAAGWATKDLNIFDFHNKAASIAVAIATYVPLAAELIYYGKENLKLLREKGLNLVYFSKLFHERSIRKGKSKKQQERSAQRGYYGQELGWEAIFAGTAIAKDSFTMWGMSNLVSTVIMGGKIILSRWYRLGFKDGVVQPIKNIPSKLKEKVDAVKNKLKTKVSP